MMLLVFALLFAAFLFAWYRYERTAIWVFSIFLIMMIGLFLYEIYSPTYGYRMPWIRV